MIVINICNAFLVPRNYFFGREKFLDDLILKNLSYFVSILFG